MDVNGWKFITLVGVASALVPLIIRSILVTVYRGGGICNMIKTSFYRLKDGCKMSSFQKMNCHRIIDGMFQEHSCITLNGDRFSAIIKLKANSTVILEINNVEDRSEKSWRVASIGSFSTLGLRVSNDYVGVLLKKDIVKIGSTLDRGSDRITLKNRSKAIAYAEDLINLINRANGKGETVVDTLSNMFGMEIYKLQYCTHCKAFHTRKEFKNAKSDVCIEHYKDVARCKNCGTALDFSGSFATDKIQYCPVCIKKFKGSGRFYDYSAKPTPKFLKEKSLDIGRFYGAEVEIEVNESRGNSRKDIADIIDSCSDHIYFKNDGSLNNGVEIITHPCTIDYHRKNTCQILEMTKAIGGSADNNSTCGLHFHVGRKYFDEQSIGMLLYLFDFYWNDLVKLSRRRSRDIRWCNRPSRPSGLYKAERKEFTRGMLGCTPKKEKGISRENMKSNGQRYYNLNEDAERYRAINLRPSATIEFRLFDGTLNPVYFLGSLQLCDELTNIAMSYKDFTKCSLRELLEGKHEELDLMISELL